jgi:hypothetical protein
MSEETTYDLEAIIDFKSSIPNGAYTSRLIDVILGSTKNNVPFMESRFEIQQGDLAGEEFTKRYYLNTFTTKKGAVGCMGLSDFRREVGKIGAESQLKQKFTSEELRKMYATIFGKKKLNVQRTEEKDSKGAVNEDGSAKMWPRYNIIGLAGPQQAATGSVDPLADLGF